MLEVGLALPLLMLMACGAMDLARVFVAGIIVESASRAGVQAGTFNLGEAESSKVNDAATSDAANQGLTGVTVTSRTFCGCVGSTAELSCTGTTCSGATPSGYVESTASYTFDPILRYPGIPRNITISSKARFRVQ